jgi:WD40 repeat protein
MKSDELREAIIQPAYQVGLEVQRELLEQIIADVSGPGSLPLMQYTLTELWRNREVNRLTLAAYNQLGGVKGTLQKRAEEIYQELRNEEQLAAKRIFLELTQLGDGTEDTRRQIYKDDLVNQHQSIELLERTLKKLTDARLLVTSELQARGNIAKANSGEQIGRQTVTAIDVAHEALIRYWPRLQTWLNENRATIRIERKIEAVAAEWLSHGKPQHDLLTGSRLLEAEHYLQDYAHLGLLSALAQEYIKKSTRQRKFNRLLRYSLFAGVVGFLAAFGIQSDRSAKKAEALAREANRKGIEAEALVAAKVEWHPVNALVTVISLTGRSQQELGQILPRVQSSLSETVSAIRERQQFQGHQDAVSSVAISPDGQTIISGSSDNTVRLWDREGNQLAVFQGHTEAVNSVVFSPDGQTIISGSSDNTVRLWDREGNQLAVFTGHDREVNSVAFSPDGQTIVSGSNDRTLRLWDIYGNSLEIFTGHDLEVNSVAFSPDGQTIVSGSNDRTLRLWDIYGNPLAIFTNHDREVNSVAFASNGQAIVSGSSDNTLRLWDRKGNQLEVLKGHDREVSAVAISSDGPAIVSGSSDNTLRLWDRKGNQLDLFTGHTEPVNSVAISSDGQTIVSGSNDKTVRLWDTQGNQLDLLTGHTEPVNSVAISSDGQTIVSGSDDNTVRLWDRKGNQLEVLLGHQKPVNSVAISPDGQTIVSGSDDNTVRLWDRNGKPLAVLLGHNNTVHSVAISPDGQTIVSGSDDKTVRLWDRNGNQLAEFRGHEDRVWSVAISPDGQTIVSGSSDNTVRLWDRNGNQLGEFSGHQDRVWSVGISPDGQMIASGSWDKTVRLWDRKGNQLAEFRGHQNAVRSVAISPDGQMIVSGSKDRTVRLWSGSWQSWLNAGCERLRLHPVFMEAEALLISEAKGVLSNEEADTAMKAVKTCEGKVTVQGQPVSIWNNQQKAEFRIKQGLAIARLTGDFEPAKNKFKQAQELDLEFYQSLGYDPEAKARELIQKQD